MAREAAASADWLLMANGACMGTIRVRHAAAFVRSCWYQRSRKSKSTNANGSIAAQKSAINFSTPIALHVRRSI